MNLGIIGASGVVGKELIGLLKKNHLNVEFYSLHLYGSKEKTIAMSDGSYQKIEEINDDIFTFLDIAIFCTSSEVSKRYIPIAINSNCRCIDHSTAYRLNDSVPLVIPEINGSLIHKKKIISSPNCCASLLCMVLYPLLQLGPMVKVDVSTYQSASGAGAAGLAELEQQIHDYSDKKPLKTDFFNRQYLLNVFSHNSDIDLDTGYNEEETKMIEETQKILGVSVNPTCIRVPVLRAHCESITITFKKPVELLDVYKILNKAEGITVVDNRIQNSFPEPVITQNNFDISVGRIRYDLSDKTNRTINLFLSGDQLLKGAALNSYQILSRMNFAKPT